MAAGKDSFFFKHNLCVLSGRCIANDRKLEWCGSTTVPGGYEASPRKYAQSSDTGWMMYEIAHNHCGDRSYLRACSYSSRMYQTDQISPSVVPLFYSKGFAPRSHVHAPMNTSRVRCLARRVEQPGIETPSFCLAALPAEPQVCYLSPWFSTMTYQV